MTGTSAGRQSKLVCSGCPTYGSIAEGTIDLPAMSHPDGQQPAEGSAHRSFGQEARRKAAVFAYVVLIAIGGLFAAWIPMIRHRFFDADEFEHAHAAWCVSKGMIPYKDFFEHHTPWYYYLLRPFFHWFDVAGSFEGATHFLFFGRALSMGLAILSVFLVVKLGRLWEHREVGLLAGLFLVSQPVFFEKAIEMRPDVLALPFFLGGLWLLLRGLAGRTSFTKEGPRYFLAAGLSLGAAIMCTQKMLFVLPGVLSGLLVWSLIGGRTSKSLESLHREMALGIRRRMLFMLAFLAGVCVPGALTWAGFALNHAGNEFIANNFLLNARWKEVVTLQLGRLIDRSWPILGLALLAAAMFAWRFFRFRERPYGGLVLLGTLVGLFAALVVMPSAYSQYYLVALPLVSLFAAKALLFLIARARGRARPALLVLALGALSALPALSLHETFGMRNDGQLARLQYVFANTKPDDVVMDGWQGLGVFRPHAFYYFFLHSEVRAMLPRPQLDAYLTALERGQIGPRLIAMDGNLFALGPRFVGIVRRNYATHDGFFYFRNGFWQAHPGGLLRTVRGY